MKQILTTKITFIIISGAFLLGVTWLLIRLIMGQSESVNNWATYTNAKYGFSFKYPSAWKIVEENDNDKSEFSDNKNIFLLRIDGDQNEVISSLYSTINIDIEKVDPQISKLDIDKEIAKGNRKITINKYDGVMRINDPVKRNAIFREIKVQKGDLFFYLDYEINFPGKDINFAKKRVSAIINSFKFTDEKLIHESPRLTREFKKRQFDLKDDKYLFVKNYDPEVINIEDNDLIPMNCNSFLDYYYGYDSSKGISDYAKEDDRDIKLKAYPEELNAISIFLDKMVRDKYIPVKETENRFVRTCTTENGKVIILDLEIKSQGFGPSDSYLGVVNNNKVDKIMKFNKLNRLAYGCGMPLLLTKSNNFYLNCTAGYELTDNAVYTYKVNLNDYTTVLIRQCEVKKDLLETKIVCQ